MKFELTFTDFISAKPCRRTVELEGDAQRGLCLYRDKYADHPDRVMEPEDEQPLLAAFCQVHDAITDHIIEACQADFSYCRRLTQSACRVLTAQQGMDWMELGEGKLEAFRKDKEEGRLEKCFPEFCAFVQFLLRAERPVPTLFQDVTAITDA